MKKQPNKPRNSKTKVGTKRIRIVIPIIATLIVGIVLLFAANKTRGKAQTQLSVPPPNTTYYDIYMNQGGKSIFDTDKDNTRELIDSMKAKPVNPTTETIAMVDEIKQQIKDQYGKYNYLDWSRFETTQVACTGLKIKNINALYDKDENVIYIININQKEVKETIAHELIHALTTNELIYKSAFYEGFTEYLALQVYPKEGGSYLHALVFAEAYVENYGLDKAMKDYIDGTATKNIDAKIGIPGITDEIDPMIYSVSRGRLDVFHEAVIIETYARYLNATTAQPSERSGYLFLLLRLSEGYSEELYDYLGKVYIPKTQPNAVKDPLS